MQMWFCRNVLSSLSFCWSGWTTQVQNVGQLWDDAQRQTAFKHLSKFSSSAVESGKSADWLCDISALRPACCVEASGHLVVNSLRRRWPLFLAHGLLLFTWTQRRDPLAAVSGWDSKVIPLPTHVLMTPSPPPSPPRCSVSELGSS